MKWIAYIRLPGLAARVETVTGGEPVAVVQAGRVLDVSAAAARRGLVPGLSLPSARAVCPGVIFRPYREDGYREEAARAWDIYARRTPRVEPDGPAGAFLELAAGDVREEVRDILAAVRAALQLEPRAGVAGGKLVARIAAGQPGPDPIRVVTPAAAGAFLAPLSLHELRLDRGRLGELERLGFRRIGDLARFPESELVRRLGPEGRRLAAWSRGGDEEPVRPLYPPPRWELEVEREGGEGIESALERLARAIGERLEASGQGAVELVLEIAPGERRGRRFARPSASSAALGRAMAGLLAGEAPARLKAMVTAAGLNWRQLTLEGGRREDLDRVLEGLRRRHGEAVRRGPGELDRRERMLQFLDPFRLRP